MIPFQIASGTIETSPNTLNGELFFYIEVAILISVILFQFIHSGIVIGKIINLQNIFDDKIIVKSGIIEKSKLIAKDNIKKNILFDDNKNREDASDLKLGKDAVRISITVTRGDNDIIERIVDAINKYLLNNYGAALNFNIIKDIIDREVDVTDEEIAQSIPTPLYLGLAATMIGIIFGLLSFTDKGIEIIDPLIRGVKYAMSASLSGLICTTLLSSIFYKRAKKKVLREKNDALNYLLEELLPELVKTEDTGVTGLKASLDRFAREATIITDNVNIAAKQTNENLLAQLQTIEKIEKMDMTIVSKNNLELLSRLEKNMDAFYRFSEFISEMKEISINLQDFATRTVNINNIAYALRSTLTEANELTHFLTIHFKKIEETGSSVLRAVDLTDSYFRDALAKLKEETDKRISSLSSTADNHHSQLKDIYNSIAFGLNDITSKHLNEFQSAYQNAVPNFQKLNHLEVLEPIRETLASKADLLSNNASTSSTLIIDILKDIRSNLNNANKQDLPIDKLQISIDKLSWHLLENKSITPHKRKWWMVMESVIIISAGILILVLGGYAIYYYFNS